VTVSADRLARKAERERARHPFSVPRPWGIARPRQSTAPSPHLFGRRCPCAIRRLDAEPPAPQRSAEGGRLTAAVNNSLSPERADLHPATCTVWREFGFDLILAIRFFATWVGHGIAEWLTHTDTQREHDQPSPTATSTPSSPNRRWRAPDRATSRHASVRRTDRGRQRLEAARHGTPGARRNSIRLVAPQ
jgi:hypothetical protein